MTHGQGNLVKPRAGILPSLWARLMGLFHISIYRNSIYLMLSSVVAAILGFFFWMAVTRAYPPADVGVASAAIAAVGLMSSVSVMGFDIGLLRFLPGSEDRKGLINCCLTVICTAAVLASVAYMAGVPLWSPSLSFLLDDRLLLVSFAAFTAATSLQLAQGRVFIAMRRAQYLLFQQLLWQILKIALAVLLALTALRFVAIYLSWGLALLAVVTANSVMMRRVQPGYVPRPSFRKDTVVQVLRFSLGNYVAVTVSSAPAFVLPLITVAVLGAEPTAYFRIAYGIAGVIFAVPVAVNLALLAEGAHDPQKVRRNALRAVKIISLLLVPATALLLVFGGQLLRLFGAEYSANAVGLVSLLGISALPMAVVELYVAINRVQLRTVPIIVAYSASSLLGLTAASVLMRSYGLLGIGIGWLGGQGAVALVLTFVMLRWAIRVRNGPAGKA